MFEIRALIRFFDTGFILKMLFTFMLASLLPVAEIYFFIKFAGTISNHLLIASLMLSGLLGLVLSYGIIRSKLKDIKQEINEGYYPESDFHQLAGIFVASTLIITPGFIGDLIGLMLLVPGISRKVGYALTRSMEDKIKEIYEYLKLYDLTA